MQQVPDLSGVYQAVFHAHSACCVVLSLEGEERWKRGRKAGRREKREGEEGTREHTKEEEEEEEERQR